MRGCSSLRRCSIAQRKEVDVPYPNEHAGRVVDPRVCVRYGQMKKKHKGKEYRVIRCQKKNGDWVTQAFRYPIKDWDAKSAKAHAIAHGATSFEAAKPKRKAASFGDAIVEIEDLPSAVPVGGIQFGGEKEDFPTQDFLKDVIWEGNWSHPKEGWELPVTIERMDRWAENFSRMREHGVEVPVVRDHRVTADATLGYVKSLFRVGDTLKCRLEARGSDSIDTIERVKFVSIGLLGEFKDGEGNEYGEVIEHIGMTPVPVIPGQGDMVRIAASRGQSPQEIPIFRRLATEDSTMDLKALAKLLGVKEEELTEENALDQIGSRMAEGTVDREKSKELAAKVETLEKLVTRLKKEAENKKGDEDEPTLSPNEAEDAAETVAEAVASVVASLGMKPTDGEDLTKLLIGPPDNRNLFLLSRVTEPNAENRRPIRAKVITGFLERIKPENLVQVGSQTGVQSFSRGDASGEEEKKTTPKEIEERAAAVYPE